MLTNTIRIGKTNIPQEQFITAVKTSNRYTEVADKLGLNKQMSPHMQGIKNYVEQLHIDTSHFKYVYNKSENYMQSKQEHSKQYDITDNNRQYMEVFKESFDKPACYINYKCTIANFMEFIKKDITETSLKDVEAFLSDTENENTRNNKTAHIKAILTYIVKNNVNNCCETISKDALIAIISM
jgi:hypothetical protein